MQGRFYLPRQLPCIFAYLQSGRPAAAAGRSDDAVEPDPAEVEDMLELLVTDIEGRLVPRDARKCDEPV